MRLEDISAALDAATKSSPRGRARKSEVVALFRKMFPDEITKRQTSLIDQALMKIVGLAMKSIGNADESDAKAPTTQLPLPGMDAPAFLMVRDENGEEEAVRFLSVTPPDFNAAINEREEQGQRVLARAADLRIKRAYLAPFMPEDTDTVADALARITPNAAAAE